jgi:hypothetical protein
LISGKLIYTPHEVPLLADLSGPAIERHKDLLGRFVSFLMVPQENVAKREDSGLEPFNEFTKGDLFMRLNVLEQLPLSIRRLARSRAAPGESTECSHLNTPTHMTSLERARARGFEDTSIPNLGLKLQSNAVRDDNLERED